MKINKFKKVGKSKYKIFFDNTEIVLYEDIILKYNLLCNNNIDIYLLEKIIEENKYFEAYYLCLNYIEVKMRNKKELEEYLSKKGYDKEIIDFSINKITSLGLLNNKNYIISFINDKINLSTSGPYKIKRELLDCDFDEEEIDKYLDTINNSVWKDKLNKIINKKKKLMKSKSYFMFVNKMKYDLINLGYDKDDIDQVLSNIEYDSNALESDINKANMKYKSDSSKVISFLLRKGYSYEEIKNQLKKYE